MTATQYDLTRNPPYQINYRAKRAGKHISASKRQVTFRFGFSRADAIAAGHTGGACRGEEHEIVLVWSHVTGKRLLCMDGKEVHASQAARFNTTFAFSWPVFNGHHLKIIAHGTSPQNHPGQRQFDLELDGMSFFLFKQIYELRLAQAPTAYCHGITQEARDDEDAAWSPSSSLEDEEGEEVLPMLSVDLFDTQPQPTSLAISPVTHCTSVPSLAGSVTSSTPTASYYDEFMPVENGKSFDSIASEILCAYKHGQPATGQNVVPGSALSRALVPVSEEGMDPATKSLQNIVNLDDITAQHFRPIAQNSPSLNKSQGQSWSLVGRAPTLSEIRDSAIASSPTAVATRQTLQLHCPGQTQSLVGHDNAGTSSCYGQYGFPNMGYASAPAY